MTSIHWKIYGEMFLGGKSYFLFSDDINGIKEHQTYIHYFQGW